MFAEIFGAIRGGDEQGHQDQSYSQPHRHFPRRFGAHEHIDQNTKDAQRQEHVHPPHRLSLGGIRLIGGPVQPTVVNAADEQEQNAGVDHHFEDAAHSQEGGAAGDGIERGQAGRDDDSQEEDAADGDAGAEDVEPAKENGQNYFHDDHYCNALRAVMCPAELILWKANYFRLFNWNRRPYVGLCVPKCLDLLKVTHAIPNLDDLFRIEFE